MKQFRFRSLMHSLEMLTVEQEANELSVSVSLLQKCARSGKLPALHMGPAHDKLRIIRCESQKYARRYPLELRWLQLGTLVLGPFSKSGRRKETRT